MEMKQEEPFGNIYNLAAHGQMYLAEGEHGNAYTAFKSILEIADKQRQTMTNDSLILSQDVVIKRSSIFSEAIIDLTKAHHLVVDLETLATSQNARVIAIGAVLGQFSNTKLSSFYRSIEMDDKMQDNRIVDASTVKWWFNQNEIARATVKNEAIGTLEALLALNVFIESYARLNSIAPKDIYVWGNGVDFDNSILLSLYADVARTGLNGFKAPFTFRQNMDTRTIYNIMKNSSSAAEKIVRPGSPHCALPDALAEFYTLANFFTSMTS